MVADTDPGEPLAAFARRLVTAVEQHRLVRLVLDLRWNRGGNTFLAAPLVRSLLGCAGLDHPGGLVVVIGRRTFSAAGNTAHHLQWFAGPDLVVVGEPSGSSLRFHR
jgi:C-terminal processing protease CtpA/Prc